MIRRYVRLAALATVLGGIVTSGTSGAADRAVPAPHRVTRLEIRILSTMLADQGLGEWGFAALVDVDGRRILFDTGAHEDTVQRNLEALGLDLTDVPEVVLSHNHPDHTTGLLPLRRQFAAASPRALGKLYVGRGIFWPRVTAQGELDDRMARIKRDYEATGGTIVEISRPTEIMPGVWLTGPVPRVHPERNWSRLAKVRGESGDVEDTVPEDMTLVFETDQGPVLLFGCGHAGVINTLDYTRTAIDPAPVRAIVGGLHLFGASDEQLAWTAGELKRSGVRELMGAHCTGIEAVYRIRELAGLSRQTCTVGAVGGSYSLERGIDAGRIAR